MSVTPSAEIANLDVASTGPDTLAGAYLRRFWTPIALLDDLAPGRAKPLKIMNQLFTLYRGESGEPHLVGFYCAHRSTQMSTAFIEGDDIRCFYHGWKYDGMGRCLEQPAEKESFAAKVSIDGYPVRVYLGLVYAYLGPGEPPPFPRIPALEKPGHTVAHAFVRHSNYWNGLENSCDQIHVNFAHRNSRYNATGINREIPEIDAHETPYGIVREVTFSDGKKRIAHTIVPTTSLIATWDRRAGWVQHLSHRVPVDDASHLSLTMNLIPLDGPEWDEWQREHEERRKLIAELPPYGAIIDGVLAGTIDLHALQRADIVNIQDEVALAAQPPVGSRPYDKLGRSDIQIIVLRRIFARELRRLANGEPLTEWTIPADLQGTSGT